jgi:hypothetical protein
MTEHTSPLIILSRHGFETVKVDPLVDMLDIWEGIAIRGRIQLGVKIALVLKHESVYGLEQGDKQVISTVCYQREALVFI